MKLTKQAIEALGSRERRLQLALGLGFSEIWINKILDKNKSNGPLTTVKSLEIIKRETGLSQEEILEAEQSALVGATDQK